MNAGQIYIFGILAATVILFLWGRWRHDFVALGALLATAVLGLTPPAEAFAGFGHPAVVTVACVLILSRGLQTSGAVDALSQWLLPKSAGPAMSAAALVMLATVLSAFMNNVGALALLMPLALQLSSRHEIPPGKILMPLAFGSILGGMTTLIGTPPNLIVAGFRADHSGTAFTMFDFAPVGLAVAAAGVLFILLAGRWLVPTREGEGAESFQVGAYLTEANVPESAKAVGMTLREVESALADGDAQVVGLVRNEMRLPAPHPLRKVREDDILIIEAEPETLGALLSELGLKLEEDVEADQDSATQKQDNAGEPKPRSNESKAKKTIQSDEVVLMEFAVMPDSVLDGYSATDLQLRSRLGINLLGISRRGRRSIARLRTMPIEKGDVLLMQGPKETLFDFANQFGCVPLAERPLHLPDRRRALIAAAIVTAAVALAALGVVPVELAFAGGVLAATLFKVVSPRGIYQAVDWPVIVMLGALMPVAGAMETTGAAERLAHWLLDVLAQGQVQIGLTLTLVLTILLSSFMNNAATAAMMCPIAVGAAERLDVNADPFLMAVAVGASCAFLTPVGHQNNTLILGPGGFQFGDYWKLGLPLELIVVAVAGPLILTVWPL